MDESNIGIRRQLLDHLIELGDRALWSYDYNSPGFNMGDHTLIEKVLLFGDEKHKKLLFDHFGENEIRKAFETYIAIGGLYRTQSIKIAAEYLGEENPELYVDQINKNHFKRMKKG